MRTHQENQNKPKLPPSLLVATPEQCRLSFERGEVPVAAASRWELARDLKRELEAGVYCAEKGYPPFLCSFLRQLVEAYYADGRRFHSCIVHLLPLAKARLACKADDVLSRHMEDIAFWVTLVCDRYLADQPWFVQARAQAARPVAA